MWMTLHIIISWNGPSRFFNENFKNELNNVGPMNQSFSKSAYQKLFFLFLNQNICCGCSMRRFFWAPKTYVKIDG